MIDPWKTSRNDLGGYWIKERVQGSSIKGGIPGQSSSSSKSFGRRFSSTRFVLLRTVDGAELMRFGQLSQQRSIDNQVTQLTVSPPSMSSPSELTGDRWNQVVFQRIFETQRGKLTRAHCEKFTDTGAEITWGEGKD